MKTVVSMGIMEKALRIAKVCKSGDTLRMFIKADGTVCLLYDENYVILQEKAENQSGRILKVDVTHLVKDWKIKKPECMEIGEGANGISSLRIGSKSSPNSGGYVTYREDFPDHSGLEFSPCRVWVFDKDLFAYLKDASLYCANKDDCSVLCGVCIDKKERAVVASDRARITWKHFDRMDLDTFDTECTDRQVVKNSTWKIADAIDCTMLATGRNASKWCNDDGDLVLTANDEQHYANWTKVIPATENPEAEFSARKLFDIIGKHKGEVKKSNLYRCNFVISDRITLATGDCDIDCGPFPDTANTRMRVRAEYLFDLASICKKTDGKCRIISRSGANQLRLTLDNGEEHLVCGLCERNA